MLASPMLRAPRLQIHQHVSLNMHHCRMPSRPGAWLAGKRTCPLSAQHPWQAELIPGGSRLVAARVLGNFKDWLGGIGKPSSSADVAQTRQPDAVDAQDQEEEGADMRRLDTDSRTGVDGSDEAFGPLVRCQTHTTKARAAWGGTPCIHMLECMYRRMRTIACGHVLPRAMPRRHLAPCMTVTLRVQPRVLYACVGPFGQAAHRQHAWGAQP